MDLLSVKVLITGAGGQLGQDLAPECENAGDYVTKLTRGQFDITDPPAVSESVLHFKPEVVFNTAAWTAVDECESDSQRANLVNGTAVGFLAGAAKSVGAKLVQVSTDYVFDGTKEGAYVESDIPSPVSAYGRSKLLGERAAADGGLVVRSSWVCSAHGGNMVSTLLRLAQDSSATLRFVDDQRGRPTFTTDLAKGLRELAFRGEVGVFHVANHGPVSWFQFAQHVLSAAGLSPDRVEPIATADLRPPRPAPRPANSVLKTTRYESLGLALRHFVEPLAEVLSSYRGA